MEETRHVSVQDMLQARDARAERQQRFLKQYASPLVSFTMNIAGSIKKDASIQRAFAEGVVRIRRQLERMDALVLDFVQTELFTGCEALWVVRADAKELKKRMCLIEEADGLGRLFDVDVIAADGSHLSRTEERRCLICGGPVRACARSRAHSAEELFARAHQIIETHFQNRFTAAIGEMSQRALLFEAVTTPKPGLVDGENSGAHSDMNLFSFMDSACALRGYFESCVRLGAENADVSRLQYLGMQAEDNMYAAAKANTHKGAIFSLGILCYAAGSCGENAELEEVLAKASQIGTHFLNEMKEARQERTGGERQFLQYGLSGARGEAASGFQTVQTIALPALEKALTAGKTANESGLEALLSLMAHVADSNIIRRAGMEGQRWVMQQAQKLIDHSYTADDLRELNRQFVQRHISPGGSADLLAVAWFLHFLSEQKQRS